MLADNSGAVIYGTYPVITLASHSSYWWPVREHYKIEVVSVNKSCIKNCNWFGGMIRHADSIIHGDFNAGRSGWGDIRWWR